MDFSSDNHDVNNTKFNTANQIYTNKFVDNFPGSNIISHNIPETNAYNWKPLKIESNDLGVINSNNSDEFTNSITSLTSILPKPENEDVKDLLSFDSTVNQLPSANQDSSFQNSIPKISDAEKSTSVQQANQLKTKAVNRQSLPVNRVKSKIANQLTPHKKVQPLQTQVESPAHQAPVTAQPDPLTQWYQMLSQYYSQFYPEYQFPNFVSANRDAAATSRISSNHLPPGASKGSSGMPIQTFANPPGGMDYANYCYQYYYGAAAAAQMWPGMGPYQTYSQSGRQTPRLYHTPHIRASLGCPGILLQVLPTRPVDGELARIEVLDLSELANEAVAEATKRAAETNCQSLIHFGESTASQRSNAHGALSLSSSGRESPGHLSSIVAGNDEDADEARACAAIASAWDRADHVFFPGPLNRTDTLKADVLAFLREKLSEIQDRLPIDWESAGLLIAFLETLIKNNGNVQTSDLVNLLLDGHELRTSDIRKRAYQPSSSSYLGVQAPLKYATLSGNNFQLNHFINESLSSLPGSQAPSGRQSPESSYGMSYSSEIKQSTKAASETGAVGSVQQVLRRAAATLAPVKGYQESEDKIVDRFRELLMHGMPMKALEHACRSQLWGHAFTLAHRMGAPFFSKVMDRFLSRAVSITDPILTLYQITAGEMPQAITAAAYGRTADNGDWRPHLAMILASESAQPDLSRLALERLGDSLLSRKLIYAAHLCYLLMGPSKSDQNTRHTPTYKLPDKIWLVGVHPADLEISETSHSLGTNNTTNIPSPMYASSEAIQLTEIYEYAIQLSNKSYRLRQLLPFRLVYAIRLLDAGLLDKSYRYFVLIGNEILQEMEVLESINQNQFLVDPVMYSLIENCIRFAEPLQYHPEIESFDMGSNLQSDGFMNLSHGRSLFQFGSTSETSESGSWLDRLRKLYDKMNRQLGRPTYGSINLTSGFNQTKVENSNIQNDLLPSSNLGSSHVNQVNLVEQKHVHPSDTTGQYTNLSVTSQPVLDQSQLKFHSIPNEQGRSKGFDSNDVPFSPTNAGFAPQSKSPSLHQPADNRPHSHQAQESVNHPSISRNRTDPANVVAQAPANVLNSQGRAPQYAHQTINQLTANNYISSNQISTNPTPNEHNELTSNFVSPSVHTQKSINLPGQISGDNYLTNQVCNMKNSQFQNSEIPTLSTFHENQCTAYNVPLSNDTTFFTPIQSSDSQQDIPSSSNPQVFDYFADLRSYNKAEPRSRTISASSQDSSHVTQHTKQTSGIHSHTSSGLNRSRQNSVENDRQLGQPLLTAPSQQQQFYSTPPSSRYPSHTSNITSHPQTIKEEPERSAETTNKQQTDDGDKSQQKDGWFTGWFGRLKRNGSKNIHLPDDSKPSIVWDDNLKQWIDVNDPDGKDTTPPPPPPFLPNNNNNTTYTSNKHSEDLMNNFSPSSTTYRSSGSIGRTTMGPRSRYVNILANQTTGLSSKSKLGTTGGTLLQPPVPQPMFNSSP